VRGKEYGGREGGRERDGAREIQVEQVKLK